MPPPSHSQRFELTALFADKKLDIGQGTIGIAGSEEGGGIDGDEIGRGYHNGLRAEGIVFEGSRYGIVVGEVAHCGIPRDVAHEHMAIAGHIDIPVGSGRAAIHHVVVVALVLRRGVILPSVAAQMMVGINAVGLVAEGHAMMDIV